MLPVQITLPSVDPYVEKTEGIITQSKQKAFMKCPWAYHLIYDKKQPLERKVKTYFRLGTAFDDLVSHGEKKFLEKYLVLAPGKNTVAEDALEDAEEKLNVLKDELKERGEKLQAILDENEKLEAEGKKPKAITAASKSVDSLKNKVKEAEAKVKEVADVLKFIQLTAAEGDLIAKLQREAARQGIFDLDGAWESQKNFQANFKGKLTLGATPDRIRLGKDGQIRELKLIEDVDKAEFKIQDFEYIQQLAFQQLLIELNTGDRLPCHFDLFDKKEVPRYRPFKVPQELLDEERNRIQAGLEFMLACYENSHFPTHKELGLPDCGCPAYEFCPGAIKTNSETYSF